MNSIYECEYGVRIDVIEIAYHRNGVGGCPFHVVRFDEIDYHDLTINRFVSTVFPDELCTAVLELGKISDGIIAFGQNSHRGDVFDSALRRAIYIHDQGIEDDEPYCQSSYEDPS